MGGAQLELDGQPQAAPFTVTGVVGVNRTLGAPSPQTLGGASHVFDSWSDGGVQTHTIATPASDATFTATFRQPGGTSPPGSLPTDGLVGHWSFDEGSGATAADSSGSGHAGTLTYGAAWAEGCKRDGCVSLDGTNDYVKVPDAAALKLTGDLTVAAWIRPATVTAKQSVVSKRYEFELGHVHDAAPHPLKWTHKGAGGSVVSGDLATSTEAGAWQHVVLVRDAASRRVRGYKDGAPALSGSYTAAPDTSGYNVNIGRNPSGAQQFRGLIDEVRIYDRVLTEQEIAALYSHG